MATKNEAPPPAPADTPAAPKRKLGKILIIAGIVLVILIAGGSAAFFMLANKHAEEDADAAGSEDTPKKKSKKEEKDDRKPSYTTLDPFTVNLASESGEQFLQIAVTLDMLDPTSAEKAKLFMAKIRNDVMLHLSGKKPSELATREGKQLLAIELRDLVNAVLDPGSARKGEKGEKSAGGPVKEVLFTSFIIQ